MNPKGFKPAYKTCTFTPEQAWPASHNDCISHNALLKVVPMKCTAAFFDMDHTITWKNSGLSSVQYARKHGLVETRRLLKGIVMIALYRLSLINIESWYEKNIQGISGLAVKDMERFSSLWFDEMIRKAVYREAVAYIEDHRARGHHVVIISNAPSFFVRPVADALDIPDIICTQVEVQDGILTGKLIRPLCYGEGKLLYAQTWAARNDIDLGRSYFYTDSYFDLPLMEVVGNPVATNPDMRLKKAALKNNWPILTFGRYSAF